MQILINEPRDFPAEALAALRRAGAVHLHGSPYPAAEIQAVFVRLRDRIDREFHALHPALRYVVSPTTGLDHIDLAHFEAHGVQVLSLKGRTAFLDHIHATAEHTIALLLALFRRLPAAAQSVARGEWDRYPYRGRELHDKTALLVGFGRIGRQVAPILEAFGCRVLAHDIDTARVPPRMRVTLAEGLQRADIVSLHLPLEPGTIGFFNAALLSQMRPGSVVINTSRGEVVDQTALLVALETKRIAGAALDVLQGEPVPLGDGLARRIASLGDRLVVTPHIGGFTAESLAAVENHMTDVFLETLGDPGGAR